MDKLQKGLHQKARQLSLADERADLAYRQVEQLATLSPLSNNMKYRVGSCLLFGANILAPACPDYSHENGCYNFQSVSNGVSLLAGLHIKFLRQVETIVPDCKITILLADQEAKDEALCQAIGRSQEEFSKLISQSVEATFKLVSPYGWQVLPMTGVIDTLMERERVNVELIRSNPQWRERINTDTIARFEMYRQINHRFSAEEMTERTIKTAAQYLAMGQFVAQANMIVCNHSTVNLCWYKESGAAVLHNPVKIY